MNQLDCILEDFSSQDSASALFPKPALIWDFVGASGRLWRLEPF